MKKLISYGYGPPKAKRMGGCDTPPSPPFAPALILARNVENQRFLYLMRRHLNYKSCSTGRPRQALFTPGAQSGLFGLEYCRLQSRLLTRGYSLAYRIFRRLNVAPPHRQLRSNPRSIMPRVCSCVCGTPNQQHGYSNEAPNWFRNFFEHYPSVQTWNKMRWIIFEYSRQYSRLYSRLCAKCEQRLTI